MSGRPITDEQKRQVLAAVSKGVHPQVACVAAGLSRSYYQQLRYRARHGEQSAQEFAAQIETAEAQGEVGDVEATDRALEPIDGHELTCPQCESKYMADPEVFAALAGKFESWQKAKSLAADIALKKLERRHPKRWSQKVIHTVQEEHQRLLDVCERVLAPEVFESLLEEYLADGSGEDEAAGGQSGQAGGGVH